jgi:hypothetical protein
MAGLLGQIFSAGNVAKRQLRDLLGNPVLAAQQMAGNLNDRARNLNEMTSAAAREGMDYGPASQRLAGLMADAYNPMGLTVFHGSPAKFNKFDRTKIGSGEGAQAYGYGHYVAESPDVARRYQMGLTQAKGEEVLYKNKPLTDLYSQIENKSMKLSGKAADIENQKLQMVEHMMLDKPPQELIPYAKETGFDQSVIDWLEKDVAKNTQIPGAFYEIDLPDEQIARMLDWDKPLSQQPKEIQSWLKDPYNAYREQLVAKDVGGQEPTGGLIVNRLQQLMSEGKKADAFTNAANFGAPNASQELFDYGIPGIRYMDEASRGQGQGTSNFVVFPGNEDLLTILKRNGGLLD